MSSGGKVLSLKKHTENGADGESGRRGNEINPKTWQDKGTQTLVTFSDLYTIQFLFNRKGLLLATVAVACIAVIAYFGLPKGDMKSNFDLVKDFGDEVDKFQLSFTNQTDRFWKILKSRGVAHLQDKDPLQPLVFTLAAPPAAHEWVDCLAIQLAEKLDPIHRRTLARIYGEKEKGNPPDTTKKTMDNFLKEKFAAGHRVALIHHLELLPPPSPLLFHSYCDDQNAPHKNVALIFTVHMPVEPSPSLSPKEAEESVEEYLSGEVWAKVDKDAVAALLSRIADIVVLMNGESSGSAKQLCLYST
ncbi:torsin-1A-interacting protein 2-like [Stylophora pistillata]|uniref:torsin-1A-interacting protein 2-like n=1 Tax=Stylophora pistillata TaxID=50429 RepID=UPI000C04A8A5|nr:torsin-1A-interacting protein 2-like [Stylophora pistillata]